MPTRPSQPPSDRISGANSGIAEVPGCLRGLAARCTALAGIVLFTAHASAAQDQSDVFSRTEENGVVVRATRIAAPLRIDGRLDEEVYQTVPAISGFVQTLPTPGAPSTERTEAWVLYDDDNFYVVCRCWDSAPPEQWVANDMRRDSQRLRDNDNFGVSLDTYHDRRNAFVFYTTPLGALTDQTYTDEGNPNRDWNQIWDVRTGRFEGGWTAEIAIPFKSLRYAPGRSQTWGIQIRRGIRRKNEWTHLTVLPPASGGSQAWFRVSGSATLDGLEVPPASRNIEIKPYVSARSTTDRLASPPVTNDGDADFGGDLKYGITPNLTADFTYNTDFAQVEVDEQQVNLTRFALSFPEKRDFFLEGRGIFEFGRGVALGGGGGDSVAPTLFYSRRIGLNRGRVIPIDVGGRMSGRVGQYSIGVLDIRTGDEEVSATPVTNFAVVRVKRDILRRSNIGAIFTNRSDSVTGLGSNQTYGADAAFGLYENLSLDGYFAKTTTPGVESDDLSYQGRLNYNGDRYGARAEYLQGRRQLQPGGRARPPRRLRAQLRIGALQPPAAEHRLGAAVPVAGRLRVPGERRRPARNAQPARQLQHRDGNERRNRVRGDELLRDADCPVPGRAGGVHSAGQLRLRGRPGQVPVGKPAAGLRRADAAARRVLRRHAHGGWLQHGPRLGDRAALGRAGHLHQLHRPAVRELHQPGASRARRLRLFAAHVRQQPAPVPRRTTACSAPTCASGGSTVQGASSSSSTPTSATRFPGARRS